MPLERIVRYWQSRTVSPFAVKLLLGLALVFCQQPPVAAQSQEQWQHAVRNGVEMAVVYAAEGKGVVLVATCIAGDLAIGLAADVDIASVEIRWQVEGYALSKWLSWVQLVTVFYLPINLAEGKRQRSDFVTRGRAGNEISIQFRGSDRRMHYTLIGFTAATNKLTCINQ